MLPEYTVVLWNLYRRARIKAEQMEELLWKELEKGD